MKAPPAFLLACWEIYKTPKAPLRALAEKALNNGLGDSKTRAHINQAWGAVQRFYENFPQHKATIRAAPAVPYILAGAMLRDWKAMLASEMRATAKANGVYGRGHYSWKTLKTQINAQGHRVVRFHLATGSAKGQTP